MDTRVYTTYNPNPGLPSTATNVKGYNFQSGTEPPVLPPVNLFNNFSTQVYAAEALYNRPSTLQDETTSITSNVERGYVQGPVRTGPSYGADPRAFIFRKLITKVEWVMNNGPKGNGVCQNEKGDWFTYEALRSSDGKGTGITLSTAPPEQPTESNYELDFTYGATSRYKFDAGLTPLWNSLKISGSYNAAIFCYNKFEYTNDDQGTIFTARSLYELPRKFDNLVSFIPDQREKSTLTYYIKVSWVRSIYWGIWGTLLSNSKRQEIADNYENNAGFGESGYDIHAVKQEVRNNNPNWGKILKDILKDRQRSLEEQDARYGQTFPKQKITITPPR